MFEGLLQSMAILQSNGCNGRTMLKLTQRFELGSNWTALKLPVVGDS
jgi:hypothetical protein